MTEVTVISREISSTQFRLTLNHLNPARIHITPKISIRLVHDPKPTAPKIAYKKLSTFKFSVRKRGIQISIIYYEAV